MSTNLYEHITHLKKVVDQTGYKDIRSLMFLYWLVKILEPEHILELGTGFGCSTIFMALGGQEKVSIVSIDDYRGDTSNNISEPLENINLCGVSNKINLVNGNTKDLLTYKNLNNELIDMVFMDASHNDHDLQQEYNAFEGVLAEHHIIVIDDVFAQDVFNFVLRLSKIYSSCSILKLHDGIAVLSTQVNKYLDKINQAIKKIYE